MPVTHAVHDCCISLIRACMQEAPVPDLPRDVTLEQLYAFARYHNVEALLYHALRGLPGISEDPLWPTLENRAALLLAQGVVQLTERDVLFDVLTGAGIPVLPMKGCWLKELYPNMEYRQMADLDMLIPGDRARQARELLLGLGYENEAFEDSPIHAGYRKPPYMEVELHVQLLPGDNRYYADVWQRAEPVEGYACLYRFPPEEEYIYYFLHLQRHFEEGGSGIRSILDSVVYRRVWPRMDRAYLRRELEQLGLWELAIQVETLADCWFVTGDPVPPELERLAACVCTAGSYGTVENRAQTRLNKLSQRYKNPLVRAIVYWVIRICRPREEMAHSYPILNRVPVLLPLFWLHRAVRKFAKHPKAIIHHLVSVFRKG